MWPRWAARSTSTIVRRSSRERASSGVLGRSGAVAEARMPVVYLFEQTPCLRELSVEKLGLGLALAREAAPLELGRQELVQDDERPLDRVQRVGRLDPGRE